MHLVNEEIGLSIGLEGIGSHQEPRRTEFRVLRVLQEPSSLEGPKTMAFEMLYTAEVVEYS